MTQNPDNVASKEAEQQFKKWSQTEYVKISKFCGSKGYRVSRVVHSKCQSLPPMLAVWYVKTNEKDVDLWVISGEFPTDITSSKIAKNAREALRHFSMSWHIQAAKLEDGIAEGKFELGDEQTQAKFAKELIARAEGLYDLYNSDKLWEASGLTL